MLKRMLIMMGLLSMGVAAGFAVFVASSADDSLRASEDDPNCIWPYTSGTLTLEYRWTSSVDSNWRSAFEHGVDAWNDLDTNVEWEHDAYGDTALSQYSAEDGHLGVNYGYCSGGSNPVRIANTTWGNSHYGTTDTKRKFGAGHELGHAMGLWHSTDDDDIMYYACCPTAEPTSNDEDAVNDMY